MFWFVGTGVGDGDGTTVGEGEGTTVGLGDGAGVAPNFTNELIEVCKRRFTVWMAFTVIFPAANLEISIWVAYQPVPWQRIHTRPVDLFLISMPSTFIGSFPKRQSPVTSTKTWLLGIWAFSFGLLTLTAAAVEKLNSVAPSNVNGVFLIIPPDFDIGWSNV